MERPKTWVIEFLLVLCELDIQVALQYGYHTFTAFVVVELVPCWIRRVTLRG